ncbi:MAG: GNAT family N-acetyltransferase [Candidatus Kerfeldbacteria bacterium]|nr:GNAT family N-acetyltransferase [Candidatus Kerfeldbacteria bacterium]
MFSQRDKDSISIRSYQSGDETVLSAMIQAALRQVNSKDYKPAIIEKMCEKFTPERIKEFSAKRKMFVAINAEQIVGTISLIKDTIFTVFVDPTRHHQGIGTQLMKYIEGVAKQDGYSSVVVPASVTAHDWYKNLGYQDVKMTTSEEHGTNFVMSKNL